MIQALSLMGVKPYKTFPWVKVCLPSLNRINGLSRLQYINDGSIDSDSPPELLDRLKSAHQEEVVRAAIAKWPNIQRVRDRDFSWRKLIDATLISEKGTAILLTDSDVFVRKPISIEPPKHSEYFIYLREDIPAYRGKWFTPILEPLVLSFNSGFVLFTRESVDFEFLEYFCRRYIPDQEFLWWSEQLAWAALAARCPNRYFWAGSDARVISGLCSRTDAQMSANKVYWNPPKKRMTTGAQLCSFSGEAAVLHLAGNGKSLFRALGPGTDEGQAISLSFNHDETIGARQRMLLAARLLAVNVRNRHG